MYDKGKIKNIETRGISDHGFISSVYFRDPNGYVVELAAKKRPTPINRKIIIKVQDLLLQSGAIENFLKTKNISQ